MSENKSSFYFIFWVYMKEIDFNLYVFEIVLLVDIYNKNDNINLINDCINI